MLTSCYKAAQSILRADYKPEINIEEALKLAVKVMAKTMDSTSLNSEKCIARTFNIAHTLLYYCFSMLFDFLVVEFAYVHKTKAGVQLKQLTNVELDKLLKDNVDAIPKDTD